MNELRRFLYADGEDAGGAAPPADAPAAPETPPAEPKPDPYEGLDANTRAYVERVNKQLDEFDPVSKAQLVREYQMQQQELAELRAKMSAKGETETPAEPKPKPAEKNGKTDDAEPPAWAKAMMEKQEALEKELRTKIHRDEARGFIGEVDSVLKANPDFANNKAASDEAKETYVALVKLNPQKYQPTGEGFKAWFDKFTGTVAKPLAERQAQDLMMRKLKERSTLVDEWGDANPPTMHGKPVTAEDWDSGKALEEAFAKHSEGIGV